MQMSESPARDPSQIRKVVQKLNKFATAKIGNREIYFPMPLDVITMMTMTSHNYQQSKKIKFLSLSRVASIFAHKKRTKNVMNIVPA